jgi:CTP synthase (UTP-ammonia lyase)
MRALKIGLIGDFSVDITAHRAIACAMSLVAEQLGQTLGCDWLATDSMPDSLGGYDALWCVPGSPYRNMDAALRAIRFAREQGVPFLGTCGGFQHAVVEYARNVLGWADADHAESAPGASRQVVSALECSLVDVSEALTFKPGSRIAEAYGGTTAHEGYHCRYGLNPAFADALLGGSLLATAFDPQGAVRGIELDGHPFFVATLFQPERAALRGEVPALARALVHAATC